MHYLDMAMDEKISYPTHWPRQRFQRAFLRWYDANRSHFLAQLIVKRTKGRVQISFSGVTPLISGYLTQHGVSVMVIKNGEFFDYLLDDELVLQKNALGYSCGLCDQGPTQYFPTREAIWHNHLFEPLLAWVNNSLVSARWLRLVSAGEGGLTAASLVHSKADFQQSGPNMNLIAGLKRIDGSAIHVPNQENLIISTIPIR